MKSKLVLALSIVLIWVPTLLAQKGIPKESKSVDWEAKAIATELSQLGDPEINMFLPELYRALREAKRAADATPTDVGDAKPMEKAVARPSMLSLLSNSSVRREIEMIDEQYKEILERSKAIQSQLTTDIGALVLASGGSLDRADIRKKIDEIREAAKDQIEETVLPFQLSRLEQLSVQLRMQREGVVGVLISDPLASDLQITDEQKERLRKRGKEIDEKLAREIARLRAEARNELFAELKSSQRDKLKTIVGDEFQWVEGRPSKSSKQAGDEKEPKLKSKAKDK